MSWWARTSKQLNLLITRWLVGWKYRAWQQTSRRSNKLVKVTLQAELELIDWVSFNIIELKLTQAWTHQLRNNFTITSKYQIVDRLQRQWFTFFRDSWLLSQKRFATSKTLLVDVDEIVHGSRVRVVNDLLSLRVEAAEEVDDAFGLWRLPASQIAQIVFVHPENKVKLFIVFGLDLPGHVTHRNAFTLHQFLTSLVRTVADFPRRGRCAVD